MGGRRDRRRVASPRRLDRGGRFERRARRIDAVRSRPDVDGRVRLSNRRRRRLLRAATRRRRGFLAARSFARRKVRDERPRASRERALARVRSRTPGEIRGSESRRRRDVADLNASRSFANQVAARTRHVVAWRATPGDARGTVSFDGILESSRRFVSALPRSTRPFTSASVVADVAAAARARRTSRRPPRRRRSRWRRRVVRSGRSLFAAPDAPRGVDASARAGALHAVARTIAQEVPGVNGYATDAAAAEASKAKVSANRVRRAATDADAETTSSETTSSETTSSEIITSARRRFGASRVGATETFPAILPRLDRASGASMEPLDVPPGAVAARVVGVFVVASDVLRGVAPSRRDRSANTLRAFVGVVAKTRSVHAVGDRVVGLCFCALNAPVVVADARRVAPAPVAAAENPARFAAAFAANLSATLATSARSRSRGCRNRTKIPIRLPAIRIRSSARTSFERRRVSRRTR